MMNILGLCAFYHDSAAALLQDGELIAAAENERFTRVKHDAGFPRESTEAVLRSANLHIDDIHLVAYYEKPLLRFERILETIVAHFPWSLSLFLRAVPEWVGSKLNVEGHIRTQLGYKGTIVYVPHHASHAAAAFFASGFPEAAILTADGIGEYQTTGLWKGSESTITELKRLEFPHSLGLLYSMVTGYLGFRVNEDEYKVMGLSAYGQSQYESAFKKIIDVKSDGSFELDTSFFSFTTESQMWSSRFEALFGAPRTPDEPIEQRHKNIAYALQRVTEEVYSAMLNHLHALTGARDLCIGGGVALNALANGKLYERTPFRNIYIFGPAGDGGGAAGAAFFADRCIAHNVRAQKKVSDLRLGTSVGQASIDQTLALYSDRVHVQHFESLDDAARAAAKLLTDGKVISWFQGKMEYGPRALGARSILADPRTGLMKDKVNRVKRRDQFQPFAASVLREYVHELFVVPEVNHESPQMLFCFPVHSSARAKLAAIVHKDGTCRIQTVEKEYGAYRTLIEAFFELTGVPCILNTSFNLRGEPIVESPAQALEDFLASELDALVIGHSIVSKR